MGQTLPVTVIKYIAEGTVEQVRAECHTPRVMIPQLMYCLQNIVALQKRKSRLARFTLNETTAEDATGTIDVSLLQAFGVSITGLTHFVMPNRI